MPGAILTPTLKGVGHELKHWGLDVQKVPGWQQRGHEGIWLPRAVFDHHTASSRLAGNIPALSIVTNGRPDLPGPLCNFLVGRDGLVVIVAAGRCYHAGEGGPLKGLPKDNANSYAFGIEIENDGVGEHYSRACLHSVVVLNAVLLRRVNRGAYFAICHKEWTPRKIDASFDCDEVRHLTRLEIKRQNRAAA